MPAYWPFPLSYVGSLMPCFLHVSATFAPTSTSLKVDSIWRAQNLDVLMQRLR